MYICICKNITQAQLEEATAKNQSCQTKDILKSLGIGSECGSCLEGAIDALQETRVRPPPTRDCA